MKVTNPDHRQRGAAGVWFTLLLGGAVLLGGLSLPTADAARPASTSIALPPAPPAQIYFRAAPLELSYEAALQQTAGVAAGRRLQVDTVRQLVDASSQPQAGGRPLVNLLALNLALDLATAPQ